MLNHLCDRCGETLGGCSYKFLVFPRGLELLENRDSKPDDPTRRLNGMVFCQRCTQNVLDYLVGYTDTEVEGHANENLHIRENDGFTGPRQAKIHGNTDTA